jgi:subtilisin family serine protease
MKRVVAHFMHESERDAARQLFEPTAVTPSFLMGQVDEEGVDALRERGLIVDVLGDARPVVRSAAAVETFGLESAEAASPGFYLFSLQGPLIEPWRQELERIGVRPSESVEANLYKVRLAPEQRRQLKALPFVSDVRQYGADDSGLAEVNRLEAAAPAGGAGTAALGMVAYDIMLHGEAEAAKVRGWLNDHSVPVAAARGRKIRAYLLERSRLVGEIAALDGVQRIEEYVAPKLHNDRARVLMGVEKPNPGVAVAQTGAGQIVAIADTGIDHRHPDFEGRIVGRVGRGRPGDTSDPHGHGTHVAGSVLGDGRGSAGKLRGVAPGAHLFFQSLLDSGGGLGGLPFDLNELFEEAYQNGARIHNNSWGSATASRYVVNSQEVDEFVSRRRDMLIVISAGNEGTAADGRNAPPGFVDWLSIGSPATCKNALTVGASRSDRTSGGLSDRTWKSAWPGDFPEPPIADKKISGDPEGLAAFSSRGPCDDHRIKPDVVAPGTDIASCKSALAPLSHFWGEFPGNDKYAFMGGTSMAAPLVTGCAALVREYFTAGRDHQPSAALLKAALINGTKWLKGEDADAPAKGLPNYHQGFGCINLIDTLPNPAHPELAVQFVDDWQTPGKSLSTTGSGARYRFSVGEGAKMLRVCLAYTDFGARALQNNLNLFLQLPSGKKKIGNEKLPNSLNIPDPDNNVEVIRIDNPEPGDYLVQVTATNLLRTPQDFALVVTGEGVSELQPA